MLLFSQIWWVDVTDLGKPKESQFSPYNNFNDYWPVWSPNGQWVLYSQFQPGANPFLVGLVVSNRTYGTERRIRPEGPDISYPIADVKISPDNKLLAFESWPDGLNHDIYIMDFQGTNIQRLTQDPGIDFGPAWRPGVVKH
jgi:Tol biopolymer transport system component